MPQRAVIRGFLLILGAEAGGLGVKERDAEKDSSKGGALKHSTNK